VQHFRSDRLALLAPESGIGGVAAPIGEADFAWLWTEIG